MAFYFCASANWGSTLTPSLCICPAALQVLQNHVTMCVSVNTQVHRSDEMSITMLSLVQSGKQDAALGHNWQPHLPQPDQPRQQLQARHDLKDYIMLYLQLRELESE